MPAFEFQAKLPNGKFVTGELNASSEQEARIKLRAQKLIPIKLVTKRNKGQSEGFNFFADKVKPKDLQVFTRQFAVLIAAGVPIVQSLDAMSQGARSPALGRALVHVKEEVERGKRLADALASRPLIFDTLYVNLVRAGEEGGVLETILQRLADYIEKSVKLRGKITGALWYPAAIIVVAFIVIAGIMIFVIPSFVEMFSQMGQKLPALTQFVVDLSHAFVDYWWGIVGTIVAIPWLFKTYYRTKDGKKTVDEFMMYVPLFGSLIQRGAIARLSRTLSTLLGAGVRILDAMDISASVAGNWLIEKAMIDAKDAVSKGKNLVEPLRASKFFPNMVLQMISVGESTGNLDQMLGKIADFYEDEVESTADALTSLVEPLLMVFLGGIIAVIVIAMYLPIFTMAGAATGE